MSCPEKWHVDNIIHKFWLISLEDKCFAERYLYIEGEVNREASILPNVGLSGICE